MTRRLCLLIEAGGARFAVPATSVIEVAVPDPSGNTLRGHQALVDLSLLLGGGGEQRPGMAVLLDTSPTLALRVRAVRGVHDVGDCPWLHVPRRIAPALEPAVRGAIDVKQELFLELDVEALAHGMKPPAQLKVVDPFGPPLPQAFHFDTGGRTLGLPLQSVAQVVPKSPRFCPLVAQTAAAGLLLHAQSAWPVFSLPGLLGEPIVPEPLIVLTDVGGDPVGFTATAAHGVRATAAPTLELKRMFS